MDKDYAISIKLSKLPLALRDRYIKAVKKLNIYYLLDNQTLQINSNDAKKFFEMVYEG